MIKLPRWMFVAAITVFSACALFATRAAGDEKPARSETFGQDWVRSHPLTIMALTLRDSLFEVEEYSGANLNVGLIWETQPQSLQACASAGLPWMQRLPELNGADESFQAKVNGLISSYPGNVGWYINDEPRPEHIEATRQALEWLKAHHPDKLAISKMSAAPEYLAAAENFIKAVQPDVMWFDEYPFSYEGVETTWDLEKFFYRMGVMRHVALRANIPYWSFVQGWENIHHPFLSESDVRMYVFALLAHGYTGLAYYTYDPANDEARGLLDIDGSTNAIYEAAAGVNAEALRLGESLKLLRSTAIGYMSVTGLCGALPRWEPGGGPYITGIAATNSGAVNNGKAGDVLIGYFVPAEDGDEPYFMIVNLLRAHGKSAAETRQQIRIDFDFASSGIDSLQRLNRLTGEVETVALTHDDGTKYHLAFELEGGTGDLFKFDTGSEFVLATTTDDPKMMAQISNAQEGVDLAAMKDWDIVVAPDAPEVERYAAEEFQKYYAEASGVTLPIVSDAERADRHVFIGASAAMRGSDVGFSVDEFGDEELKIIVRDDNIAIAGGPPRGTLYGVYTFVEDYLGVRFLTAEHTHVPKVKQGQTIDAGERVYRPPTDYRWTAYEINYDRPDFCARLRLNAQRGIPTLPVGSRDAHLAGPLGGRTQVQHINHSMYRQVPPQVYAKDHPEYFCLRNGKRWATLKPGEDGIEFKEGQFPYGMQPCFSHPDVFELVRQSVLEELSANPSMLNVSVAGNDGGAFCQCPECTAINDREGSIAGSVLTFVNKVADEVAREFPDRLVGTIAYSDTQAPPATVKPRDNVAVMFCSIGTCFVHTFEDGSCPTNAAHIAQLRQWAAMTKHLYAWNYLMNDETRGYQLPMPNLWQIGPNVRFQVSLGVKGFFMQATSSEHGNEFEDLRNYMLAQLMWDPTLDDRKLMNEWIELHYGPAAPPIRKWIDRLHERSIASGKHCRCMGGRYEDYGLDESDVQAGLDAVEEAMRLAGDDQAVRQRVSKASIWAYRAALEPVWNAKPGETIDPAVADRLRPYAKRFFELCKEHGVTRTREVAPHLIEEHEQQLQALLGSWNEET